VCPTGSGGHSNAGLRWTRGHATLAEASEPASRSHSHHFDRGEYIYEALQAGASGFLLKDVRAGQLTEAVRTAASGDALLSPSVTRHVIEEYVRRPPRAEHRAELAALTDREREVLTLIAAALSNAEIGERLHVTEATVKTHVNRLLSKLGLRDRVQAVVYAYESNLISAGVRLPNRTQPRL
jgi:DNA-binding NarL/FixJ family response regulator